VHFERYLFHLIDFVSLNYGWEQRESLFSALIAFFETIQLTRGLSHSKLMTGWTKDWRVLGDTYDESVVYRLHTRLYRNKSLLIKSLRKIRQCASVFFGKFSIWNNHVTIDYYKRCQKLKTFWESLAKKL